MGTANPEDPISLSVYTKGFGLIQTLLTSSRSKIILKKENLCDSETGRPNGYKLPERFYPAGKE